MDERTRISSPHIDPKSGFNRASMTFPSLKPPLLLPPPNAAVSVSTYVLPLRCNSLRPNLVTAIIDAATGHLLSYGEFIHRAQILATNLTIVLKLSKGDTTLVLHPNLIQVPILYFALLSLDVVLSPVNPLSTCSELTRLFNISNSSIIFAVSLVAEKTHEFHVWTILLDSLEFDLLTKNISSASFFPVVGSFIVENRFLYNN